MKKILFCILLLLLWASPALSDEVEDRLGAMATEQQRTVTRAMINAGIDPEDSILMTQAMIRNRFRDQYTVRAQQLAIEAKKGNLPVEPVMNKAFEGIAKKAPDEAVVRAMETVLSRYAYAYAHALRYTQQNTYQRKIGNAIAEATTAGLANGNVNQLMTQLQLSRQQRDRYRDKTDSDEFALESFQMARDMMRLGVPTDETEAVISQAIRQTGFTFQNMQQMRHRFREQASLVDPEQLALEYSRAIREGAEPGSDMSENASHGSSAENSSGSSGGSGSGNSGNSGGGDSGGGDSGGGRK